MLNPVLTWISEFQSPDFTWITLIPSAFHDSNQLSCNFEKIKNCIKLENTRWRTSMEVLQAAFSIARKFRVIFKLIAQYLARDWTDSIETCCLMTSALPLKAWSMWWYRVMQSQCDNSRSSTKISFSCNFRATHKMHEKWKISTCL